MQSSKPIKKAWATETVLVFVVNSSVAVGEIHIKVIVRDISGGHFSKLETFVVGSLMVIEDRNCAGRWYTKSVPWKRKSWIKLSDPWLQNSLHSRHWLNPWGFFGDCEAAPNYYRSNQKLLLRKRWRHCWSQYSNQMVQKISLGFQVPQQSEKVK